ncbi:MAG: hypothetical protein Q9217_004679 [Psora testacea]
MAKPRRRSSRISSGPTPSQKNSMAATNKLSSLIERDESPDGTRPNIDAVASSPSTPRAAPNPVQFGNLNSTLKTPPTASHVMPPKEEMHPSKVHQSTTKPSVLRGPLSSQPVRTVPRSPSKIAIALGTYHTPTKAHTSLPRDMTSPTFDFSFERPESDLSAETQKIMDSVREEAAKIKAQMLEERIKQEDKDGEINQLYGVGRRQIRKAKGKSDRFSDVHKQEFKKMDSIANHASTWKHKLQGTASSPLKRSPSKAGLDETPRSLPRPKSSKNFYSNATERLEDIAPGKRAKRTHDEDHSLATPSSRDATLERENTHTAPAKTRPSSGLPNAVTTPTKASLARSASVKSFKSSMIPSLSKSASAKTFVSPTPRTTEGSNKRIGSWSKFGGSVKSILHLSRPKFSNDLSKVAAGTHLPLPRGGPKIDKDLPKLPGTPTVKRVNFTSSTKSRHELAASNPPSALKLPGLHRNEVETQDTLSSNLVQTREDQVVYPDLGAAPNTSTRNKSPRSSSTPLSMPGDFTFRTDKTITFNPTGFTSPNGTTTIRHVRPSGIPTSVRGAFDKEMPAIPHGMSSKKRKHVSSDEEDEIENVDPQVMDIDIEGHDGVDGRPNAKKQRVNGPPSPSKLVQGQASPSKRRMTGSGAGGSRTPKKASLSLSRLNMLARPRGRR